MKEKRRDGMVKKGLLFVLLIFLVLGMSFGTLPAAELIEWRVDSLIMATSDEGKTLQWFCDQVKERSGGRLKLTVYPGSALGVKITDIYHALKMGTIEMSLALPMFMVGHAPALDIESRDGIWENNDRYWLMNKLLFPYREKIFNENWGIHSLGSFPLYTQNFGVYTRFPVKSWKDLQGKKIRSSGEDYIAILKSFGVSPVFLPVSEIYMALKNGLIDGIETSPRTGVERSLFEVAKYYTVLWPGISGQRPFELLTSKKHWDKLPADLQVIMQECANDAIFKAFREALDPDLEKPYYDKLKAEGVNTTRLPSAESNKTVKAARQVFREYIAKSKDPQVQMIYKIMEPFLAPVQ